MSQIKPTGMQGRSEAENQACNEGAGESEKQNGRVNRNFIEPRHVVGQEPQQKSLGAEKNRQAGDSAEQGEKHALGQQLPHQTRPRGTERLAKGYFASSRAGAREQEISNIDAADQQDQSHGPKQQN